MMSMWLTAFLFMLSFEMAMHGRRTEERKLQVDRKRHLYFTTYFIAVKFLWYIEVHTAMPQNEYVEQSGKRCGYRLNHFEKKRKKESREPHTHAKYAHTLHGLRAKLYKKYDCHDLSSTHHTNQISWLFINHWKNWPLLMG